MTILHTTMDRLKRAMADKPDARQVTLNRSTVEAMLAALEAQAAAQPVPDAVAEAAIADDDSLARRISELGWQIHNLGCEYQNDEKLLDRLQDLRGMAWEIADTVREGAA